MKILLLGSGGREHALAWKIVQSDKCEKLFIAPGNAGTAAVGENVAIKADDFEALKQFCVENNIDMVVVGPEDPLVKGVYDNFRDDERTKNIPVIGPSKAGAVSPQPSMKLSTVLHSKRDSSSWKHSRLLMYSRPMDCAPVRVYLSYQLLRRQRRNSRTCLAVCSAMLQHV